MEERATARVISKDEFLRRTIHLGRTSSKNACRSPKKSIGGQNKRMSLSSKTGVLILRGDFGEEGVSFQSLANKLADSQLNLGIDRLRKRRFFCRIDRCECACNVKFEKHPLGEFVHSVNHGARGAVERFRHGFKSVLVHFDDIADLVDEEAHRPVVGANYDINRQLTNRAVCHTKATSQIDSRDNLATQVDQAADYFGNKWHPRHLLEADDFLHLLHRHSKELPL